MDLLPLPSELVEVFTENASLIRVTNDKIAQFISTAEDLDPDQSELLRRLAISLEHERFEDGWSGLKRIYTAAAQADPNNIEVLISLAVSALDWFEEWSTPNDQARLQIALDAEQALNRAAAIAPDDAGIVFTQGLLYYNHPARHMPKSPCKEKALRCFEHAHALQPDHQMAILYQAHCYHDLGLWQSAYQSYLAVDMDTILLQHPAWLWRKLKRDEQLALCAAKLGNTQESTQRLEQLFDEIEALEDEQASYDVVNLDEAVEILCTCSSSFQLMQRLMQLLKRLGFLERYEQEIHEMTKKMSHKPE
ncbi:tetratricopeptide repeat protein [Acaryochloris marina NIES-2412]|uniref:tetratricopeptide repeat protein n=1 Tax=Acaryochloris marina TaxID=155978 RepID=UPI004059E1EA